MALSCASSRQSKLFYILIIEWHKILENLYLKKTESPNLRYSEISVVLTETSIFVLSEAASLIPSIRDPNKVESLIILVVVSPSCNLYIHGSVSA